MCFALRFPHVLLSVLCWLCFSGDGAFLFPVQARCFLVVCALLFLISSLLFFFFSPSCLFIFAPQRTRGIQSEIPVRRWLTASRWKRPATCTRAFTGPDTTLPCLWPRRRCSTTWRALLLWKEIIFSRSRCVFTPKVQRSKTRQSAVFAHRLGRCEQQHDSQKIAYLGPDHELPQWMIQFSTRRFKRLCRICIVKTQPAKHVLLL